MKYLLTFTFAALFYVSTFAQNGAVLLEYRAAEFPEYQLVKGEYEQHLMYLASDELGGRRTGSEGGEMAAKYIAEHFEKCGVKPAPGQEDFFQNIPFQSVLPPEIASLILGETEYVHGENLLIFKGGAATLNTQAVFAGHGWQDEESGHDDYDNLDVKGKVVFTLPGMPDSNNPYDTFRAMQRKRELAMEQGAVGLVELFRLNFPWRFFKSNFNKERMEMAADGEEANAAFFYGFLKEDTPNPIKELEAGQELAVQFTNTGLITSSMNAANVVGYIEGTDDSLKNECVLLSAHYDHVGIGKQGGAPYTEQDSIFNGARDNGMGTVALMAAAQSLAAAPPKRSVILLACTAEEMGLLGSAYYVEHPLVPLEQTVFNLNNDGAGYNSTEHFTVIGLKRTSVDPLLELAGKPFGLSVTGDPAPSQNLYERSDNINFAKAGIPAIDMAPGITEMNEEVYKYYHQAPDNPETIDYDYFLKFCQTYAYLARLIADGEEAPEWAPGGEFERN